jgi:spoIIIJ-associated protein
MTGFDNHSRGFFPDIRSGAKAEPMSTLTDASRTIAALVSLLRLHGDLEIAAEVYHTDAPGQRPELIVDLAGPDARLLTARNGELLHAIEHIAATILGLEPGDHDRISFDAAGFKASRDHELRRLAEDAILQVRSTASAYTFPPMMSRERRLLHLVLAPSGLKSASTGEHFRRSVVLYPEGVIPPTDQTRPNPSAPRSN